MQTMLQPLFTTRQGRRQLSQTSTVSSLFHCSLSNNRPTMRGLNETWLCCCFVAHSHDKCLCYARLFLSRFSFNIVIGDCVRGQDGTETIVMADRFIPSQFPLAYSQPVPQGYSPITGWVYTVLAITLFSTVSPPPAPNNRGNKSPSMPAARPSKYASPVLSHLILLSHWFAYRSLTWTRK